MIAVSDRFSLFNSDDTRVNDLIVLIRDNINYVQNQLNLVSLSENNDMQYNKQADKCSQIIIETLRMRIIESTKLFKKALQKRSEVSEGNPSLL
jgi:hypothetical protein